MFNSLAKKFGAKLAKEFGGSNRTSKRDKQVNKQTGKQLLNPFLLQWNEKTEKLVVCFEKNRWQRLVRINQKPFSTPDRSSIATEQQ